MSISSPIRYTSYETTYICCHTDVGSVAAALTLVKCTGAVHDTNNVAIPPAGFADIGVDNSPESEKVFVIMKKFQTICFIMSQEFATGDS